MDERVDLKDPVLDITLVYRNNDFGVRGKPTFENCGIAATSLLNRIDTF